MAPRAFVELEKHRSPRERDEDAEQQCSKPKKVVSGVVLHRFRSHSKDVAELSKSNGLQ